MPGIRSCAQRLTTKAKLKPLKFLSLVTCHLSLVLILSGCRAIGTAKPAALQVTSTPEASVFLDGKHLGKTPFFSDQLKSGEYTLKITASEATYVERVVLT
ncbi:PEGA domain-containing protein, partial [Candidatus Curtissbacteria bacterium]|nr:PEGA domain-containing protein [Candidatus Curtissbacteria bacterium]